MSSFDLAVKVVLDNEGGYTNDPNDHGGPTNWGITLAEVKEAGLDKNGDGIIDARDVKLLTIDDAKEIYIKIWNRYKLSTINHQGIATKLFDTIVNLGAHEATLVSQRALHSSGLPVKEDGVLGPKTINALNNIYPVVFLAAMRSEQAGVYRVIVAETPSQNEFLEGWLNRAYQQVV